MAGGARGEEEGEEERCGGQGREGEDGEAEGGGEVGEGVGGAGRGGEVEDGGEREGRDGEGDALLRSMLARRFPLRLHVSSSLARDRQTRAVLELGRVEPPPRAPSQLERRRGAFTVSRPRDVVPTNLRTETPEDVMMGCCTQWRWGRGGRERKGKS